MIKDIFLQQDVKLRKKNCKRISKLKPWIVWHLYVDRTSCDCIFQTILHYSCCFISFYHYKSFKWYLQKHLCIQTHGNIKHCNTETNPKYSHKICYLCWCAALWVVLRESMYNLCHIEGDKSLVCHGIILLT